MAVPQPLDGESFLEYMTRVMDANGIDFYVDEGSYIYVDRASGLKTVDFRNGMGPVATQLAMESELNKVANEIKHLIKVPITTNQFTALTSFAQHIGIDNFAKSSCLHRLNEGFYEEVPRLMARWRTGKVGRYSKAGVRQDYVQRRQWEGELFSTPEWIDISAYLPMSRPNCTFGQLAEDLRVCKLNAIRSVCGFPPVG